jgi:tetratricopeptide (TPR) repeat protein
MVLCKFVEVPKKTINRETYQTLSITNKQKQMDRLPQIKFSDKASTPLQLSSQQVNVQITLPIAKVTSILTFVNPHDKVLEGEFEFPLPDDATLIGYALDVGGTLVDAVPIEKEKAKVVFEEEVRSRGKGVSIVEMSSQSNSFKTRIYPLNPKQQRTVQVVYTMPVESSSDKSLISIPFGTPSVDASVSAQIEWYQGSNIQVALASNTGVPVALNKSVTARDEYSVITVDNLDLTANVTTLVVSSSQTLQDNQITVEDGYFCARMKVNKPDRDGRMSTSKIQILWDNSFSRLEQHQRDVELLEQILQELAPTEVVFTPFSVTVSKQYDGVFTDINTLMNHLSKVAYDGATNLSQLESILDESVTFCVVFTDGIHTLGKDITPETVFSVPMYIVSSGSKANSQLLSQIATKSGGTYMNANTMPLDRLVEQIGKPVLYFLVTEYEDEQFEEVYPNEPVTLDSNGYFHLYGKIKSSGDVAVSFRYGSEIIEVKELRVKASETKSSSDTRSDRIIPLLWAKQKMNSMLSFPSIFEEELCNLGREWSIVTPTTSLIVLEDLEQYIKHKIIPPATLPGLRKQYLDRMTSEDNEKQIQIKNKLDRVANKWQQTVLWHQRQFELKSQSSSAGMLQSATATQERKRMKSALTADDARRKREDRQMNLRKQKRSEHLGKRRSSEEDRPHLKRSQKRRRTQDQCEDVCGMEINSKFEECRSSVVAQQNASPFVAQENASPFAALVPWGSLMENSSLMFDDAPAIGFEEQRELYTLPVDRDVTEKYTNIFELKKQQAPIEPHRFRPESVSLREIRAHPRNQESSAEVVQENTMDGSAINVQKWTSDAAYMDSIKNSGDQYQAYLKERNLYKSSPGFYLDVADYWLTELEKTEQGINILTNILELELENAQLFRIVGYRLSHAKLYDLAENVFDRVKKLRPDEPQSYRDLALVKEKLGKYEEAAELLNKVITDKWDMRFDEIELTAAIELNHCLEKDSTLKLCDERLRYKMELDLRVCMAWDTNDTDIDLHVNENVPRGEHCYYVHKNTAIGGLLSKDFTRGQGPEWYMLKQAPSGEYAITAKYFSNHQQSLTGGTTVICTFFTNYMRPNEKSETVTLRLTSNKNETPVCVINV